MYRIIVSVGILASFVSGIEIQPITPKFMKPYGLFYDVITNKLFWTDYFDSKIACYDLNSGLVSIASTPGMKPWYIVPIKKKTNRFIINDGRTNYIIHWDTTSSSPQIVRSLFTVESNPIYANDTCVSAKVAPNCDLVFGILRARLCDDAAISPTFSYNKKCGVKKIGPNLPVSGEITWNADGTKFYQVIPCEGVVREYDYNSKTGKLSNPRIAFSYHGPSADCLTSVLFGLTMDIEGNLVVGVYHGAVVLIVNPKNGKILRTIRIPGEVIGSLIFGGPKMDKLYVSTFSVPRDFYSGSNSANVTLSPDSGRIFVITGLNAIGVRGRRFCYKDNCPCANCQCCNGKPKSEKAQDFEYESEYDVSAN